VGKAVIALITLLAFTVRTFCACLQVGPGETKNSHKTENIIGDTQLTIIKHYRVDGQPLSSVSNVTREVFPLNKLPYSICIKNIERIFVKHFKRCVCVCIDRYKYHILSLKI